MQNCRETGQKQQIVCSAVDKAPGKKVVMLPKCASIFTAKCYAVCVAVRKIV